MKRKGSSDLSPPATSPASGSVKRRPTNVAAPSRGELCKEEGNDIAQAQIRSACRSLLSKAFTSAGHAEHSHFGGEEAEAIVRQIEEALFERHGRNTSREYKAAGRSLGQNLKRNSDLRRRLMNYELEAKQLVYMEWQDLSTVEQRQQDEKLQEKLMRLATLNSASALATDEEPEYTCPECRSNTVEVLDAGRRDIGKCETWGSKSNDDRGRLITCLSCSHRWEVSGLA